MKKMDMDEESHYSGEELAFFDGIAGSVHDLRNCISIAISFLEIPKAEIPFSDQKKFNTPKKLEREIESTLRLFEDTLAIAITKEIDEQWQEVLEDAMSRGRNILEALLGKIEAITTVDLAHLVRRVALFYQVSHPAIPLSIRGGNEPVLIEGKKTELQRALCNLIQNAVEAIERGNMTGSMIEIYVSHDTQPAFVIISDNGPGIPESILTRLTQPGVTSKTEAGHGFGLNSATRTIREHGGNLLTITNTPRFSTTFVVSFST